MRTCADCGRDISIRPSSAYLCASCAETRQRLARKAYYEKRKREGLTRKQRFNGSVGTTVVCITPACGTTFVKKAGNHRYCDPCREANESYHDTAWNSRNPNRAHGPALIGRWGGAQVAA